MKGYGVNFPLERRRLSEQRAWIQGLEALGYESLWSSEARQYDGLTPLALASEWAPGMRLGCAVLPAQTRGPALLAMSAATLAQLAPGRVAIGIGSSSQPIVEWWNSIPFEKPYAYVRDLALFLREALAGGKVDREYESFAVRGFRLGVELETPPRILIGALRSGMLRLAGSKADGAILNYVAEEDLDRVVPLVKEHGDAKEVLLRLTLCPTSDVAGAREIARRWLTAYMTVPTYRAHQEWLGRGDMIRETCERWERGDRAGAVRALPDAFVERMYVIGSLEECRKRVRAFLEGGVDTVILQFMEELVDPFEAVRALAPD